MQISLKSISLECRQMGRRTDRQAVRLTDTQVTQTDRQTDRQTDSQTDRHIGKHADRQTDRQTDMYYRQTVKGKA